MPANSFAAIRPDDTNHAGEFIRRYSPRRWNGAPTPLFAPTMEWRPNTKKRTGGKCPRCVMVAINR
jgi:hypothetical protein